LSALDPAYIALSLVEHVGSKKLTALLDYFGTAAAVLAADPHALQQVAGIGPKIAAAISMVDIGAVEAALPRWQAQGVQMIPRGDPAYPARLAQIDDPPPTLFVRGKWDANPARTAAIVGTRQPSPASRDAADVLSSRLVQAGCVVISGLAHGVDHQAHWGALSGGGSTIAVLGSGVLNIYPPDYQQFAEAITKNGALVCEVHPEAAPSRAALVARNRLISGLSDLLIVIETAIDGGAMHAARRAAQQGRRVYALDNDASGNRLLIEQSAYRLRADLPSIDLLFG
jgi:DNA processing protein